MNTYLREGYRELEDTNFYQKIPDDITNKISDRIAQQLLKMRSLNLISDKNFEYLNIKNPTEARFYLLHYQRSTKRTYLVDQSVAQ